jgi:hypothetical protein
LHELDEPLCEARRLAKLHRRNPEEDFDEVCEREVVRPCEHSATPCHAMQAALPHLLRTRDRRADVPADMMRPSAARDCLTVLQMTASCDMHSFETFRSLSIMRSWFCDSRNDGRSLRNIDRER